MGNLLIIYASSTGNTELMADAIEAYLRKKDHQVVSKTFDYDPINVEDLLLYDGILIGTYTWDDGELPYEVEDFYEELEDVDLTGKPVGVFGSADSFYDTFGGAIDLLADRLQSRGAVLLDDRIKVDLTPKAKDIENCELFTQKLIDKIE
ncbi:flavodoxin [Virgibacillus sp. SK37]|uniref:flavodoxin n=1 Tax=Virgibacillus sp. SK37 TaxID=403957 RepID=UPI0004D0B3AB|nr:flavodoxin [Virgibacillus sp. SK37]AIF44219.1 flavodoxin [Virgibacillus sp. SK37]